MRIAIPFAAFFLFGCSDSPKPVGPAAPVTDVTLKSVKWPELEKAIAAHKGRIVVIDLWANY
jgi:PBP1b-binding outer membrane lipoprotein LpoB